MRTSQPWQTRLAGSAVQPFSGKKISGLTSRQRAWFCQSRLPCRGWGLCLRWAMPGRALIRRRLRVVLWSLRSWLPGERRGVVGGGRCRTRRRRSRVLSVWVVAFPLVAFVLGGEGFGLLAFVADAEVHVGGEDLIENTHAVTASCAVLANAC